MNNAPAMANPLDNLRDIHLPEPVSAWPPAPGWWILAILVLVLIVWIVLKIRENYNQKQLLRVSLSSAIQLEQDYQNHKDPQLLVREYSSLLRRIALARFPRHEVASLTGSNWLTFLDDSAKENLFDCEAGKLLLFSPYQKPVETIEQLHQLTVAVHSWIKAVDIAGRQR
ncbi:MAG: DUF4381 domain-containing protein [Gammaproteobacteria bacterium]|nr:DUF4381 domain-containing protein [Gammaproteobacteria bacterium]